MHASITHETRAGCHGAEGEQRIALQLITIVQVNISTIKIVQVINWTSIHSRKAPPHFEHESGSKMY